MKINFKVFDNVISDKHVESFVKFEYKPKKAQPPLTNIVVCHLETNIKDEAVRYCSCIYKLSKISGNYHQDITEKEYGKSLKACVFLKEIIVLMIC